MDVFKLYAVHTGHQPGPLDGNARIMHRVLGHKGGLLMEHDMVYGVTDEAENECVAFMEEDDMRCSVLQQVKELKKEVRLLEGKLTKIPIQCLGNCSIY
ncbi:hypothetical protein Hdeb2414_s0001g00023821 [Helianthus debilis subsp. tardiflorus]